MAIESTDHPLQKWQEAVWLLIVLLTPLFVNFWVEQQFEASKIWLLRTLVCILAVLWLSLWLKGHQQKAIPSPIRTLIIALVLILALSTFLSSSQSIAIFGSDDRANGSLTQICYLLLFGCVASQIDPARSRQLLLLIILTAVPICLLGLAQAAGWQPLPIFSDARTLISTTLGRANFTGAYLALLLPLTLAATHTATIKSQRLAFGALCGLELIIIGLTQARAAWIAALVGIGLYVWLHFAPGWSRRVRWSTALGGIVGIATLLLLILQRGIANGGSIAARWTIWQASTHLLWPRLWLGYGADTLELIFPSVYPPQLVYYQGRGIVVDRAHNWLLDWSLNYGVVATLIFIALVIIILRAGWQQLKISQNANTPLSAEESLAQPWLAACMAGIGAQLVGNLFLFEVAATAVVFWLLLAIVLATTMQDNVLTKSLSLPFWLQNTIIVSAILVAGWIILQGSLHPLLADVHSWRGTQALNRGNPLTALNEYETAVQYQPHRATYHTAVALTAVQLSQFMQAEAAMNEAITLRPTDPVLYTQLAAIYAHQAFEAEAPEKITLAYDAYERAIALSPTTALTYQQVADLALRSGDWQRALALAQRAVDLDATDGISFGILGWAQLQVGNFTAAQSAFEQAVKWQPDSADFHLGLATTYFQQGQFTKAKRAVEDSLARDPAYTPTLTLQLQLQDK